MDPQHRDKTIDKCTNRDLCRFRHQLKLAFKFFISGKSRLPIEKFYNIDHWSSIAESAQSKWVFSDRSSETRLGDLLDFGQFLQRCQNLQLFYWNHFWATFIDIWQLFTGHTVCGYRRSRLRYYYASLSLFPLPYLFLTPSNYLFVLYIHIYPPQTHPHKFT